MDTFIVSYRDPINIQKALKDIGITDFEATGMYGAAQLLWYEEEGLYIRRAKLVVVIVDQKFMDNNSTIWGVHVALDRSKHKDIFLYFVDPSDSNTREKFFAKWDRSRFTQEFSSPELLVQGIRDYHMKSDSASASEVKINMYIKALLLEDALNECTNYVQKCRDNLLDDVWDKDIKLSASLRKTAEVHLALGNNALFEQCIQEAVEIFQKANYGLTGWASIQKELLLDILHVYYTVVSPDPQKAAIWKPQISHPESMQEARIFFETARRRNAAYKKAKVSPDQTADDTHRVIAKYIRSSVDLFEVLGHQGVASGFVECLKESYERLARYCKVIGDPVLEKECIDILYKIQTGEQVFSPSNESHALLNIKCIKAFLGKTLPDSQFFDAFISHKSNDTELAEKIFLHLQEKGKEVFLDRVSLPILGDAEYRNSILQAIDNSTHLVLVCSDLSFLESKWVSEEYNLFCDELREGRKNGNILLVFTRDVCQQVYASNKKCLPIQLRSFEIIEYETFTDTLSKFIL